MYYGQLSFFAALFFEVIALIAISLFNVRVLTLIKQMGFEEFNATRNEPHIKEHLKSTLIIYLTGILIATLFAFIGMVIGAVNWFKATDNFRYFAFAIGNLLFILFNYKLLRESSQLAGG